MKKLVIIIALGAIGFGANAQTVKVNSSTGNVGIGTGATAPAQKLHVVGNAYLSNASIGRSGTHYDEFGFNIGFTNTSNLYTYRTANYAASIRMGYNGDIEFRTAPVGTAGANMTLTERMKIALNGNVGIGSCFEKAHACGNNKENAEVSPVLLYHSRGEKQQTAHSRNQHAKNNACLVAVPLHKYGYGYGKNEVRQPVGGFGKRGFKRCQIAGFHQLPNHSRQQAGADSPNKKQAENNGQRKGGVGLFLCHNRFFN
jgi:hypothetical protein